MILSLDNKTKGISSPQRLKQLRETLERTHDRLISEGEVFNDAQEPARQYKDKTDQEFAAFLCALFAYGRVDLIKRNVGSALKPLGKRPVQRLLQSKSSEIIDLYPQWTHRFNDQKDLIRLLFILRDVYSKHENLSEFVGPLKTDTAQEILERLVFKIEQVDKLLEKDPLFSRQKEDSFWYLLPRPSKGSACKRLNLFLRWMVGDQASDFGLWPGFSKSNLIIPVDVHVLRQSQRLGLTQRKTADWKTAVEITEALKKLDPDDPTRFDFAICHIGIRGL